MLNSKFSAHKTPLEFVEWLIKEKGKSFIDNIRIKSFIACKPDYALIELYLNSELKKYKTLIT